jgi:DNA-binding XRE family transcriptional regulator
MHERTLRPVISLRLNEWERRMKAQELATDSARAEKIGVSRTTVSRVQQGPSESGGIRPGENFIAGVLYAFPDLRFEDVFEVEQVAQ